VKFTLYRMNFESNAAVFFGHVTLTKISRRSPVEVLWWHLKIHQLTPTVYLLTCSACLICKEGGHRPAVNHFLYRQAEITFELSCL